MGNLNELSDYEKRHLEFLNNCALYAMIVLVALIIGVTISSSTYFAYKYAPDTSTALEGWVSIQDLERIQKIEKGNQ